MSERRPRNQAPDVVSRCGGRGRRRIGLLRLRLAESEVARNSRLIPALRQRVRQMSDSVGSSGEFGEDTRDGGSCVWFPPLEL